MISEQQFTIESIDLEKILEKIETCLLALLHWEMACSAVPAPSEMKLTGKLSALTKT